MTTSQPTNASEWQLYYVLQRANLLQYYDTFVAQGGDDVPQLCEAGEEEFLEIMALVGMASKPLHVRRLQKALQEWVANPAAFQCNGSGIVREPPTHVSSLVGEASTSMTNSGGSWNIPTPPLKSISPVSMMTPVSTTDLQPEFIQGQMKHSILSELKRQSPTTTPALSDEQIHEISLSAERLIKSLPAFEPKSLSQKKDINKQIHEILNMPVEYTPERLELMRKYGAIYRRFDSDRAYSKPMTLHEICVNEAAAQLCYRMPSLLTRREDLFPLSRQVVKGSGYQYSKGHSRSTDFNPENPSKRQKLELLCQETRSSSPFPSNGDRESRQERLLQITKELASVAKQQELIVQELDAAKEGSDLEKVEALQSHLEEITNKHLQLLTEQRELLRKQSMDVYIDFDGSSDREDSNLGASGSSSPAQLDKTDPSSHANNTLKTMLTTGQIPKSSLNSLSLLTGVSFSQSGMKNSLFDEGLRIAQQYGLGDFELELKSLQGGSPRSDSKDGDEETGFIPSKDDSVEKNGASNDLNVESHNGHDHPENANQEELEKEEISQSGCGKRKRGQSLTQVV